MKKIFEQLQQQEKDVQTEIEKRNETFKSRTKGWQYSTKGRDWQEKTAALVSVAFAIEEAVAEFETYNEL